jgi:hypothetical protein
MAPNERRPCRACEGVGFVVLDASYDYKTGELVKELGECLVCKGFGSVPLFLYKPQATTRKPNLRKLDDEAVWRLCWCGSAREKHEAEKELRRREGGGR